MSTKPKGLSIQAIVITLLLLAVFFGWLGYQPGTRMKSSPDTGLCHTGFRGALTAPAPKAGGK